MNLASLRLESVFDFSLVVEKIRVQSTAPTEGEEEFWSPSFGEG